jgi:acyl dehydratase
MTRSYSLNFSTQPSLWTIYPRILAARKPTLAPQARLSTRIDARLAPVQIDADHLARYRELCGSGGDPRFLPLTYPHVLAAALHLAMLSSEGFPVRLMGLVHVRNRIEQRRPLRVAATGELRSFVNGHRETDRGQEFELHTEWHADGDVAWNETSTFLARRRHPAGARSIEKAPHAAAQATPGVTDLPVTSTSFRAPAGLGRAYGRVSGDMNPIHLSDLTARAFGFDAAIAHGMWSLARCVAELDSALPATVPRILDVSFRLPVLLPAWLLLQSSQVPGGLAFELRDSHGERPHLSGSLSVPA